MLTQITDEKRVNDLWDKLRQQMRHGGTDVANCRLVYRPSSVISTVHWIPDLMIWGCFRDDEPKRRTDTGIPLARDILQRETPCISLARFASR